MTVSMGRFSPLKDHFVVAWAATMVVRFTFLGFLSVGAAPQCHNRPPRVWALLRSRAHQSHNASVELGRVK